MRKYIAVILAVVMLFVLTACGAQENNNNSNIQTEQSRTEGTKTETEGTTEDTKGTEESKKETTEATTAESIEQKEDTIRPEFKEAMDAYEAFYDEYCKFMEEYKKNPTDLSLLGKYTEMLTKLDEMNKAFEAWDEDEMSTAELKYYLDVNNRVTQKMIDVIG